VADDPDAPDTLTGGAASITLGDVVAYGRSPLASRSPVS